MSKSKFARCPFCNVLHWKSDTHKCDPLWLVSIPDWGFVDEKVFTCDAETAASEAVEGTDIEREIVNCDIKVVVKSADGSKAKEYMVLGYPTINYIVTEI